MNERLQVAYETIGASSYMTVTCPPDMEPVHYQMEMVLSNEIRKLLPVSRQTVNGETILYYNITSRISLAGILEKRKLARKELLKLLDGVIQAVQDAGEFRLPEKGIMFHPEAIFVNPADCDPAFVFLPVPETEGWGIRDLLTELIMNDRIEMSNGDLVQILLQEINSSQFSVEKLEKSLKPYQMRSRERPASAMSSGSMERPSGLQSVPVTPGAAPMAGGQAAFRSQSAPAVPQPVPVAAADPVSAPIPEPDRTPPASSGRREPGKPSGAGKKAEKKSGKKSEKSRETDEGFDAEKAKKKFLLPQAVIMVAAAASISFGLFTDEAGNLVMNNILAFVILLAVTEVILYREAYVNGKKQAEKKKQGSGRKKAPGKQEKRPEFKPVPSAPSAPQTPMEPPSRPVPAAPSVPFSGSQESMAPYQRENIMAKRLGSIPEEPVYQPEYNPAPPVFTGAEDTDMGDETEVWGGAMEQGQQAYLEYYDNGRLNRIPVDPVNGTVIGRLQNQVDFAVKSPRVGKIHARFFCQDGGYFVVDINSKNGTYINGSRSRIESNVPYPLQDGDRIMVADCEFTIRCMGQ